MARIEERNGRWRARVWAPDGRERSRTFDRKTDADRWAVTQEADKHRGTWIDPTLSRETFDSWAEKWRGGLHGRKPSTLDRYDTIVRLHLSPRFGPSPLARITPDAIRRMIADDLEAGASDAETRRHATLLRQILTAAVKDGRLGKNPADSVELPSGRRSAPMRFLDGDQVARLADAFPAHHRPLVLTAAWVGLRWGELAGLRVEKVDLLRRKVTIDEQLTEVRGRLAFGSPKSRAGVRVVTVPGGLTDVLGEHLGTRPVRGSGMAFPSATGELLRRSNFRRLWRRKADDVFADTDLEGLVFHELRHTAAALAIRHGAHPKTLQVRLGHSSITTTLDTYGHLFDDADEALAEALDAAFRDVHPASTRPETSNVAQMRRSER